MVLYISLISILVVALSAILIGFSLLSLSPIYIFLLIIGGVICEFAIDGLIAEIIHLLPKKFFGKDNKFYQTTETERKFYEKIKIRKWKDKVWELGSLGGFSKKELKSSNDLEYIEQFIIESNKGVLTHLLGCFAGFFLLLIYLPFNCLFQIALPIAIANVFLNLPSLFILKYNLPKLHAGYKRILRTQEKTSKNRQKNLISQSSEQNTSQTNSENPDQNTSQTNSKNLDNFDENISA